MVYFEEKQWKEKKSTVTGPSEIWYTEIYKLCELH